MSYFLRGFAEELEKVGSVGAGVSALIGGSTQMQDGDLARGAAGALGGYYGWKGGKELGRAGGGALAMRPKSMKDMSPGRRAAMEGYRHEAKALWSRVKSGDKAARGPLRELLGKVQRIGGARWLPLYAGAAGMVALSRAGGALVGRHEKTSAEEAAPKEKKKKGHFGGLGAVLGTTAGLGLMRHWLRRKGIPFTSPGGRNPDAQVLQMLGLAGGGGVGYMAGRKLKKEN